MKKTNDNAVVKFLSYSSPEVQILDIRSEGILCSSFSSADDMTLGDELNEILEAIENDVNYDAKEKEVMRVGVHILPKFNRDTTDRNRTSPFAFTGNKFEFRSLGSSMSIACPNIMLNTITADVLCQFADELEKF